MENEIAINNFCFIYKAEFLGCYHGLFQFRTYRGLYYYFRENELIKQYFY